MVTQAKILRIQAILLGVSMFWGYTVASAQVDTVASTQVDTAVYQMTPTIVTSSRYRQPLQQISDNVTVITTDQLDQAPVHNLLEGLHFTPGFVVRKNGGFGTRELVSIQGSEPRHVTFLLDGIPFNNVSSSLADPVRISLGQTERVEIVKGPASTAWGSALGGVVQVLSPVLEPDQKRQIRVATSYARWNTHQEHASLLGGVGGVGYMVSVDLSATDGFRPKGAHDGTQIFAKAERKWGQGRLGLSYGQADGETEDFEQFGRSAWKKHEYTTRYGQFYYRGSPRLGWETHLQFFGVDHDEEVFILGMEDDQVLQRAVFDEPVWGSGFQLVGPVTSYGRGSGGVDLCRSRASFGYVGGPDEKRFDQQGIFANWNRDLGALTLNAGLRLDRHSLYGSQWSPGAGLVYRLEGVETLLRARVGSGFGAPSLDAAFFPEGETTAPNPDLEPERVTAYHVGVESSFFRHLWLRVTLFRNEVKDAIDTGQNEAGKFVQMNFAKQWRQGVEVEGRLWLALGLSLTGGVAINRVESGDEGEIINGTARLTQDWVVQYRHPDQGFSAWLGGHYADHDITPVLKRPPYNFTARDGRFIWDAKFAQKLPSWEGMSSSLYLAVHNLLDTEFWWLTPYPLPGRAFEVGIRLEHGE